MPGGLELTRHRDADRMSVRLLTRELPRDLICAWSAGDVLVIAFAWFRTRSRPPRAFRPTGASTQTSTPSQAPSCCPPASRPSSRSRAHASACSPTPSRARFGSFGAVLAFSAVLLNAVKLFEATCATACT